MKALYTIWQYVSVTFWLVLFGLHFVILCSSLPWWVAPQIVSLDWNWTLNKSVRALSQDKVNMKQNVKWKKTNAVVPCSGAGKPCFATLAGVAASSSSSELFDLLSERCFLCLYMLESTSGWRSSRCRIHPFLWTSTRQIGHAFRFDLMPLHRGSWKVHWLRHCRHFVQNL